MCKLASFFHNPTNGDIAVYDLTSHEKTSEYLKLNLNIWREGHYLPNGTIECRITESDRVTQEECNERLRKQYPTFISFLNSAFKKDCVVYGLLDLHGCDLTGIELPTEIGCSLYLSGCDLNGIKLPEKIGGSLDLRGCDLTGVTLPNEIGGWLDLGGCDLTGIILPAEIGGWLYLSGCVLTGVTLPNKIGGWLDLGGCDLTGIKLPTEIGDSLYLNGCDLTGVEIPEALKHKVIA